MVITDAEGNLIETEPWSCVTGTPPISHLELADPARGVDFLDGPEDGTLSPASAAAAREWKAQLDEYIREWGAGLRRALSRLDDPEHPEVIVSEQAAGERLIVMPSPPRFVTRPNGQQVQIDDEGWGLTKSGRRDMRYKGALGPPLT